MSCGGFSRSGWRKLPRKIVKAQNRKYDDVAQHCLDRWHLARGHHHRLGPQHVSHLHPARGAGDLDPAVQIKRHVDGEAHMPLAGYSVAAWSVAIIAFCLGLFIGAENTTKGQFRVPVLSHYMHRPHLVAHWR